MANAKKKDASPGVFDVSKPGKSAPSATSKPVIVTNRPLLQDPMVNESPSEETAPTAKREGTLTIKPITITSPDDVESGNINVTTKPAEDTAKPTEPEVAETQPTEAATAPAAEAPASAPEVPQPIVVAPESSEAEPAEEPQPAEIVPDPATETPAVPVPDEKPAEENSDQPKPPSTPEEEDAAAKKAIEEAAAHDAAIQKLVDSQQYFLPITTTESRKTKRFILLGVVLILVLGLAWADIALDAGLIHVSGVKAVTHFFTT